MLGFMRSSHCVQLCLLSLSLVVPLAADQVVLTNGDTLTGTVIKKEDAKLTLKSDLLGEVVIPWTAVKSVTSSGPLYVAIPGGTVTSGTVTTSGSDLQVAATSGVRSVPLAQVSTVRNPASQQAWEHSQHPGLLESWTGHVDLGLALARGNARTDTLTSAADAARTTPRDRLALHYDQIYGTARVNGVTSTIASAVRGSWTYERTVSGRLFVNTLNSYEHDGFLGLDLRFVAGGGLGYNPIKNQRTTLGVLAGADYSRENFIAGVSRNSAEFNAGNNFLYKLSSASSVTQSFRVYTNLSNTGAYRLDFDLSAVTAIRKWLSWHVTASDRFLSNPLFGRQRNDILLSTGFRVSFTH